MTLKAPPRPISWADSIPKPDLKKVLEAYLRLRDRSNPNNNTA